MDVRRLEQLAATGDRDAQRELRRVMSRKGFEQRLYALRGDVEALEEHVSQLNLKREYDKSKYFGTMISDLSTLYETGVISYSTAVEIVTELLVGVPVTLVAIHFYGHSSNSSETAERFAQFHGIRKVGKTTSGYEVRLSSKRGTNICFPKDVYRFIQGWMHASISFPTEEIPTTNRGYYLHTFACKTTKSRLPGTMLFEFIPDKMKDKTRTRSTKSLSFSTGSATNPMVSRRRHRWFWDGRRWVLWDPTQK